MTPERKLSREKLVKELLAKFLWQLAASTALPRASWWALQFLQDWTTAASSGLVSACWEDWSAAAESYLVFAMGLNCCPRRLSSPQRTIAEQVHFPYTLILLDSGPLLKVGCKKCMPTVGPWEMPLLGGVVLLEEVHYCAGRLWGSLLTLHSVWKRPSCALPVEATLFQQINT